MLRHSRALPYHLPPILEEFPWCIECGTLEIGEAATAPQVSEVTHADGTIERIYTNGTQLLITADNQHFFHYANADWRYVDANGVEVRAIRCGYILEWNMPCRNITTRQRE